MESDWYGGEGGGADGRTGYGEARQEGCDGGLAKGSDMDGKLLEAMVGYMRAGRDDGDVACRPGRGRRLVRP